jgi:hypothetical protein
MAVENVKLNSGDDKARVAYQMALGMWNQTHGGNDPKIDDQIEFLDLVQNCARAISPRFPYSMGKKAIE